VCAVRRRHAALHSLALRCVHFAKSS
jgi:hypothetical protein